MVVRQQKEDTEISNQLRIADKQTPGDQQMSRIKFELICVITRKHTQHTNTKAAYKPGYNYNWYNYYKKQAN